MKYRIYHTLDLSAHVLHGPLPDGVYAEVEGVPSRLCAVGGSNYGQLVGFRIYKVDE